MEQLTQAQHKAAEALYKQAGAAAGGRGRCAAGRRAAAQRRPAGSAPGGGAGRRDRRRSRGGGEEVDVAIADCDESQCRSMHGFLRRARPGARRDGVRHQAGLPAAGAAVSSGHQSGRPHGGGALPADPRGVRDADRSRAAVALRLGRRGGPVEQRRTSGFEGFDFSTRGVDHSATFGDLFAEVLSERGAQRPAPRARRRPAPGRAARRSRRRSRRASGR